MDGQNGTLIAKREVINSSVVPMSKRKVKVMVKNDANSSYVKQKLLNTGLTFYSLNRVNIN